MQLFAVMAYALDDRATRIESFVGFIMSESEEQALGRSIMQAREYFPKVGGTREPVVYLKRIPLEAIAQVTE